VSRPYRDLVNTFPTIRSFIAARLLQEVDAGNRVAVSAYNDVLGWLDESDRQQAEEQSAEADRIRGMRCSDYAEECQSIRDGEFARLAGEDDGA